MDALWSSANPLSLFQRERLSTVLRSFGPCLRERSRLSPGRLDWLIASALACLVLATRLPFRTTMLYNWDSANFGLALDNFDVTRHFPHPPGDFYYVMVARAIRLLLSEANASLVAEGILFSTLAVVALYFLGKTIYDRPTGVVAALLLAFSVTYWSFGTVALPYVSLATLSTATAFLAYRATFAGRDETLPLAMLYAVGGGFRPDLMLFLGPLLILSLARRPLSRIALAVTVIVAGFLLWYVPTVWLSGGPQGYHSTLLAYLQVDVAQKYSPTHRGLPALLVNLRDTLSYLFYALYFTLIPLLAGASRAVYRVRTVDLRFAAFLACWVAPMALFYVFVHVGDPGYVFTILPALVLLAARTITHRGRGQWEPAAGTLSGAVNFPKRALAPAVLLALVLAGNIGLALFYPRQLTLVGIRASDVALQQKIEYIRNNLAPESSLLVSYETYRHLQYYLPQYKAAWIDLFDPREQLVGISPEVAKLAILDQSLQRTATPNAADSVFPGIQVVPLKGEKRLVFAQHLLRLE